MKPSQTALTLALLVVIATASGCGIINGIRAKKQLNDGAGAYHAGHYTEAQQHFEQAYELDPSNTKILLYIARTIHQQYKPGVDKPENVKIANEAIDAYQKVLAADPNNDEAYKGIAYLYGALKEDDKQHEWIEQRAKLESAPPEQRSDAYTVLASKDWQCSQTITEQKENQKIVPKGDRQIIQYQKPKDPKDYDKALQCATEGKDLIDQAVNLNNNSELAWSYKTNLLRELAKLAEMNGDGTKKADYTAQADEAQKRTAELSEENKRKKEEKEKAAASPPATS